MLSLKKIISFLIVFVLFFGFFKSSFATMVYCNLINDGGSLSFEYGGNDFENIIKSISVETLPPGQNGEDYCKNKFSSFKNSYKLDETHCYNTINGEPIYKFSDSSIQNNLNNFYLSIYSDYDSSKLITFNPSCQDENKISGTDGVGSISDSGSSSSGGIIENSGEVSSDEFSDYDISKDSIDNIKKKDDKNMMKDCSLLTGPNGLFSSKSSCEDNSKGLLCLYQPFLGGIISGLFVSDTVSNDKDLYLKNYKNEFEASCLSKKVVLTSCSNIKSESLCLDMDSCFWKNISIVNYSSGDNLSIGFCFNKNYVGTYYSTQFEDSNFNNYIPNPSFEFADTTNSGWFSLTDGISVFVNSLNFAHYGSNSFMLNNNGIISSNIGNLLSNNGYYDLSFYGAMMSANPNTKVEFGYNYKLKNGTTGHIFLKNFTVGSDLSNYLGIFKKFSYDKFHLISNVSLINLTIKSYNGKVFLDDISLTSSTSDIDFKSSFFSPVSLISPKASKCSECFDGKFRLNSCTKEKSDSLGDCSYMVNNSGDNYYYNSSLSNYIGRESNIYMINSSKGLDESDNWDLTWKSQSLPNSYLFCGLYLTKNKCLDPSNYVNSKFSIYHLYSGSTLCKWKEDYGCFKDSDNNGMPDTLDGKINFSSTHNEDSLFTMFSSYNPLKDFNLSCDVLPPERYIYFQVKNKSGSIKYLTINNLDLSGDVIFNLNMNDIGLTSCNSYNFDKKLFVEILANGNSVVKKFNSNIFSFKDYAINFFKNSTSNFLKDGINDISLNFYDQSGNKGKNFSIKLNLDLSGPTINISSDMEIPKSSNFYTINRILTKNNKNVSFNFSDLSGNVTKCEYFLYSSDLDGLDYDSSLKSFIPIKNGNIFNYTIELPIINTSSVGNWVNLNISCYDLFNQKTTKKYYFRADFNTDLVLVKEKIFNLKELVDGVFNKNITLNLVSSDLNLFSCNYSFDSGEENDSLNIDNVDSGFELSSYPDITFVKNISSDLNFLGDGIKNGTITCRDENNNIINLSLIYIYDTKKPLVVNYSIVENLNVVNKNNHYYFNSLNSNIPVLFQINATGSYLSSNLNNYSLSFPGGVLTSVVFNQPSLTEDISELDSIKFSNYYSQNSVYYSTEENNLYTLNYTLNFSDSAGNKNNYSFFIYYDNSTPKITFGNNIKELGNKLYSKEINPNIEFNFSTPNYRTFSCNMSVLGLNGNTYAYNSHFKNDIKFKFNFSEILGENFNLSKFSNGLHFNFKCVDLYGKNLNSVFNLYYDNVNPILDKFEFKDNKYIGVYSKENINFKDINDSLIFKLNDTGENYYNCSYKIVENSNVYTCNTSIFSLISNVGNTFLKTSELKIISANSNDESALCYRNSGFVSGINKNTSILFKAFCIDGIGLKSNIKTFNFSVNYINNSDFFDFNYTNHFSDKNVDVFVKNLIKFDNVIISKNNTISGKIIDLEVENKNGEYHYSGIIFYNNLNSGINNLKVLGIKNGIVTKIMPVEIKVDYIAPIINMSFPDLDKEDGKMYYKKFDINLNAFDNDSSFKDISLELNDNQKILNINSSGGIWYNGTYISIITPVSGDNIYSGLKNNNLSNFKVKFINGSFNEEYKFRFVAEDEYGNVNSTIKNIKITFDINGPKFIFSGNNIVQKGNVIYTDKKLPKINLTLKPKTSMLNYTNCFIYYNYEGIPIKDELNKISNNNFTIKISDYLDPPISLANMPSFKFDFKLECKDNYDYVLPKKSFQIRFDNVSPQLNFIKFKNLPQVKYFINNPNMLYPNVSDNLIFDLNNTNEDYLNCNYNVSDLSNYGIVCNSSIFNFNVNSLTKLLLGGFSYSSTFNGYICYKSNSFVSFQNSNLISNTDFTSQIKINGWCEDVMGHKSQIKSYVQNISFISSGTILGVNTIFNLTQKKVYLDVISFVNYDGINISKTENFDKSMISISSSSLESDGLYHYKTSLDYSNFKSGENILYALAKNDGLDVPVEVKKFSFIHDFKSPNISISFPQLSDDGKMYYSSFNISIFSNDDYSNIKSIRLYDNNILIFNSSENGNYKFNSSFIDSVINITKLPGKKFNYTLNYINGVFDSNHNFKLIVEDLYYNKNKTEVQIPIKSFGGDLNYNFYGDVKQLGQSIYSDIKKPVIKLNVSADIDLTFICSLKYSEEGYNYNIPLISLNKNSFKLDLSNPSINKDISKKDKFKFLVFCMDNYGHNSISPFFYLKYDNVSPILSKISLLDVPYYLKNNPNLVYDNISADLNLNLIDTKEVYLNCYYKFEDLGGNYECNSTYDSKNFTSSLTNINLVSKVLLGGSSYSNSYNGFKCYKPESFVEKLNNEFENDKNDVKTQINISAYCKDILGHKSNSLSFIYNLTYLAKDSINLASIDYNFTNQLVTFKIVSTKHYEDMKLSSTSSLEDSILNLNYIGIQNGLYYYSGKVSYSNFETGENLIYALGLNSNGDLENIKQINFKHDFTIPNINLQIPNLDGNSMYFKSFNVNLDAKDSNSGIQKLILSNNNQEIFNYYKDNGYQILDLNHINLSLYSNINENNVTFKLKFQNYSYGDKLNLTLFVQDMDGNVVTKNLNFNIELNTNFKLQNLSPESYVSNLNDDIWITNKKRPSLSLIAPTGSNICFMLINGTQINGIDMGNSNFIFNLSNYADLDLSSFSSKLIGIKVSCMVEGAFVNYNPSIYYIDFLPDYVLKSKKGFIISDYNYKYNMSINSVGIYNSIKCNWSFDSNPVINIFSNSFNSSFVKKIDFSNLNSGVHNLNIVCEDPLGNIGPKKSYQFKVDKSNILKLSNLNLFKNNFNLKKFNPNIFKTNPNIDKYNLDFDLNHAQGVSCLYSISNDNFISGFVIFIKNLLNIGVKDIPINLINPYEFRINNLIFGNDYNILDIVCTWEGNSYTWEYEIDKNWDNLNVTPIIVN